MTSEGGCFKGNSALGKSQEQLKSSYPILIDPSKHWQKWIVNENSLHALSILSDPKHINGYFINSLDFSLRPCLWLVFHVKFLM